MELASRLNTMSLLLRFRPSLIVYNKQVHRVLGPEALNPGTPMLFVFESRSNNVMGNQGHHETNNAISLRIIP